MESADGLAGTVTRFLSTNVLGAKEQSQGGSPMQAACLLVVAATAVIWVLLKLASVLVPLTFAVFLGCLVEPILRFFVLLPSNVWALQRRAHRRCQGREGGKAGRPDVVKVRPGRALCEGSAASSGHVESAGDAASCEHHSYCHVVRKYLQLFWDVIAILLCVLLLFAVISGIVAGIAEALVTFDWSKYANSPKFKEIEDFLAKLGIKLQDIFSGAILTEYKTELMSAAMTAVGVLESVLLTILLFFFVLVAMLPGIRSSAPTSRMKTLMQRYLLCKTIASVIISLAVMLALWLLHVPLVFIFGVITFTLNFIPNLGSFFAIVAPLPLVALEPETTILDVVMVAVVPFLVHNVLGNTIEPKLMASGLDMHPLTVVVALTFWGSMWGVAGAVLAVPITSVFRLWLEGFDDPFARTLYSMFDAPMGGSPKAANSARGVLRSSSAASSAKSCRRSRSLDEIAGKAAPAAAWPVEPSSGDSAVEV